MLKANSEECTLVQDLCQQLFFTEQSTVIALLIAFNNCI